MDKSTFTTEYTVFLQELKRARKTAGLAQWELAERLGQTQSFVSKCERGERRLDIIECRAFCQAMGIPFERFIEELQRAIRKTEDGKRDNTAT